MTTATKKKIDKCSRCCPDGGAYHVADVDLDGQKIWTCNNCGQETRRIVRNRVDEHAPLTRQQLLAVTRIQLSQLDRGEHEIKRFTVRSCGEFVSVVCEVGLKGDEGTMASICCRRRGHFFVRRGGKIEAVDVRHESKAKARKYPLIYGWRS